MNGQPEALRLADALDKAQQEIAVLREALDFYARNIGRRKSTGELILFTALDHDCGDRARAALETK